MVAEARPTPPSLTSISPSSSALTLQPIDPPPNLSSPLPTIPVHPNHHDHYPCYHHPTHPHHDHLLYSTTAHPILQEWLIMGLPLLNTSLPLLRLISPSHHDRCCCLEDTGSQRTRESKTSYAQMISVSSTDQGRLFLSIQHYPTTNQKQKYLTSVLFAKKIVYQQKYLTSVLFVDRHNWSLSRSMINATCLDVATKHSKLQKKMHSWCMLMLFIHV